MTVVLAGVGADSTNLGSLAPLYDDGLFEYVPIPEKTRQTSEEATLGSWHLEHDPDGRTAADMTTRIEPTPISGEYEPITGSPLESWPLHHDPNFEALTYGEHRSSGYVSRLGRLEPGDVVGFYAGLRRPGGERAHRYLIGYLTVDRVDVIEPEMPADERSSILARHPENAHVKRASESELRRSEKPVVLVDGREPGGLFDRHPIRLSTYEVKPGNERPQYYLRPGVKSALEVTAGGENMMFKPAYECALERAEFSRLVGPLEGRAATDAAIDADR